MRRSSFIWTVALLPMLALSGCGSKDKQEAEATPEVTVDVAPVLGTSISQKIVSDAVIFPILQSPVSSKISAPIKKLYVERGDHVKAGQVVAELESQDLNATLNEANVALKQA